MQKMAEKINSSLLTKPDLSKKITISGGNNMMSHQNCASLFSFLWSAILWTYKCKLMLLTTRANIQRFALIRTEEIALNILSLNFLTAILY